MIVQKNTRDDEPNFGRGQRPAHLVGLNGKDLGRVLEPGILRSYFRFTHDGKRIVYCQYQPEKEKTEYWIVGVDGKDNRIFLPEREMDAPNGWVAFSPDAKRMAVSYFDRSRGPDGKKNSAFRNCRLEIVDSNGSNPHRVELSDDFDIIVPMEWR